MDIGVFLPTGQAQWQPAGDPRDLIGLARRAEESGFASLFVNDSLLTPRIEPLTMLAAVAPVTERIRLGTGALLPVLRRPVQAAQALASVDLLSGGRLTVTVGAGFPGRFGQPLHELSQVPWERRFARLDETVALWRALWAGATEFHGEFHSFPELPPATLPFRPDGPPVWLGGATPSALARTGRRYDGWLPYPPQPADYAAGLAGVRRAAREAGRPPEAVTPALFVNVRIDDDAEAARRTMDAYGRSNYGLPLEEVERIQAIAMGTPEQVAATLRRYTEAGAEHVVARLGALDLADQYEQLERLAALTRPGSW
ncbi:LLM class flavin-dependent oxidoreductase [Kitasatospora cathayae]|uniref:LLM class flavin-dependent oxidoreductase n=1 Tax=Kitasatospora cathayae TaxID=3004092 RepID=A0ABY7Q0F3_9ACTN|nr:LLM class flavin-dependent oxidoreductase [Kitasatospora sp. HUAS 3-15]WBP86104.1 LLM class flavin-dependent oxidoreductase [Kitasatospora sp. HUAS 3-15]